MISWLSERLTAASFAVVVYRTTCLFSGRLDVLSGIWGTGMGLDAAVVTSHAHIGKGTKTYQQNSFHDD